MNAHVALVEEDPCLHRKDTAECPGCGSGFTPRRANQNYCSRCCQKNAARGDRYLENFKRDEGEAARARNLRDMLYDAPPGARLGVMKDILDCAPHDGGLRNILTRPDLLGDRPFASGKGRMNIAKAADAYVRMFYGMSIRSYIRMVRKCGQPPEVPVVSVIDSRPDPAVRERSITRKIARLGIPLPAFEDRTQQFELDLDRVSRIVAEVQSRTDALPPDTETVGYDDEDCFEDETEDAQEGAAPKVRGDRREAKRKIALSAACFNLGIEIDSPLGRQMTNDMGIRTI